jgi:hypothetical protein
VTGCRSWKGGRALRRGPRRSRYSDHVIQRICRHVDSIAQWKECVEALNELRISMKQQRNPLDDTRGINPGECNQLEHETIDIERRQKLTLDF